MVSIAVCTFSVPCATSLWFDDKSPKMKNEEPDAMHINDLTGNKSFQAAYFMRKKQQQKNQTGR